MISPLWGVHISDNVLAHSWHIAGWVIAVVVVGWSLYGVDELEIPRIGLMTAACFVASSIHVRIGPTSAHLILNGLAVAMLGRRAPSAIGIGLALQTLLLQHGGWYPWGINLLVMAIPALLVRPIIRGVGRPIWAGFIGCGSAVLGAAALNASVLAFGSGEGADFRQLAKVILFAQLGVAVVEAMIGAVLVQYLDRVKPELLGRSRVNPSPTVPADRPTDHPISNSTPPSITTIPENTLGGSNAR